MRAHLAYQPHLPSASRYLQFKWDCASYELHREKVKSAKSILNITPPKTFNHLSQGLRKHQLSDDFNMKVQRDNSILLQKILLIKKTTGATDNRNYYLKKSLGKEKNQQELLRITKENQRILFRLSSCKPSYSVKSWQQDWRKHRQLMESITRYPGGRTSQKKEQEKSTKMPRGCDEEHKSCPDPSSKTRATSEENGSKEAAEPEEPEKPEKPIPAETSADEAATVTAASSPPEGPRLSNTHHTPEQEAPTSTEE